MNHQDKLRQSFEAILRSALAELQKKSATLPATGMLIQPNPEGGELLVFDDQRDLLCKALVEDWGSEDINSQAEIQLSDPILKQLMVSFYKQNAFAAVNMEKPFVVQLVDDDFDPLRRLFVLEDEEAQSDDKEYYKQLDRDLNDFYQKLMSNW